MATASIHVNKLAAAKRQIQAAIRLFFQPEDELAVHTVAAAAYGLLKDIKSSRGMSQAADVYLIQTFYAVRDFHRGTLPPHMTGNPAVMAEIERLARLLTPITADSKLSDVRVSISPELERQYWNDTNRSANFLKHADRDIDTTLSLEVLNNELLLLKCLHAYQDVAPDDLGNEGLVFRVFVTANNEAYVADSTAFGSLVTSIRRLSPEQQRHLCFECINDFNANEKRSAA